MNKINQLTKQYINYMPLLLNTMYTSWLNNNDFYAYICRNSINKYIYILCYLYKDVDKNILQDVYQDLSSNQCQLYPLDHILIGYNMSNNAAVLTAYSEWLFNSEECGIILTVYQDNKYIQFQYWDNAIQCIITDTRGKLIDIKFYPISNLEQLLKDLKDKYSLYLQKPLIQLESIVVINKL